ncbi:DUF2461 domain-containing protein [Algirhabdus cladophorae]|uniref:DUF2461 domain-containing protein n=1 Tax=Algirhabdus cladophorae TaxID=3377108 RepID=UPI003B8460B2
MDGFTQMIDAANEFFLKLRENNTKPFYEEHKAFFISEVKKPAELFAQIMAEEISKNMGMGHTEKVFRIYRDVRFSKDKTPYNTHLHIFWQPSDQDELCPGFFFASTPERLELMTGVMGFRGETLARYRAFIDKWGDLVEDAITETGAEMHNYGADPLKKVPKPYDPEHPHGPLLKRKSLIIGTSIAQDFRKDGVGLVKATRDAVRQLKPFRDLLVERL